MLQRKLCILGMFSMIACESDKGITQFNVSPEASITSHSDGAIIYEGQGTEFHAQLNDDNHNSEDLLAAWYAGTTLICDWIPPSETGRSSCSTTLSSGQDVISVAVRDPDDAGGRDEIIIDLFPNSPPTSEITSPIAELYYFSDELILFSAIIDDVEDDPEDLTNLWSSNLDGSLPIDAIADSTGIIENYAYLTEGEHAIQLQVEDTAGKVVNKSVVIEVLPPNSLPDCTITNPQSGEKRLEGTTITFEGEFSDDIPSDQLMVEWQSDRDGLLLLGFGNTDGTTGFTTNALSRNTHTISLIITDEYGASCTDSLSYVVEGPPLITINNPLDQITYIQGDLIDFEATVSDQEDPPNQLALYWSSSIDGMLSEASSDSSGLISFSRNDLSNGTHVITFEAMDSYGLTTQTSISITLNAPPTINNLNLSPSMVYTNDTLISSLSSTDLDGDILTYQWDWYVDSGNGNQLTLSYSTTSSNSSLDGLIYFERDDIVTVDVFASDGLSLSSITSTSIVISNSIPTDPSVYLFSYNPTEGDDIDCTASGSTDDDSSDSISYNYSWTLDGNIWTGATTNNGTTIPGSETSAQQSWICWVHTSDGSDSSNSIPSGAAVVESIAVPQIHVTPQSIDFTTIATGCSIGSEDFTISNLGTAPLEIQNITLLNLSSDVTLPNISLPVTLAPSGVLTYTISYTPTVDEILNGELTVTSTDPNTPTVIRTIDGQGCGDMDLDGICDNADGDKDGDGILNGDDDYPSQLILEQIDMDFEGFPSGLRILEQYASSGVHFIGTGSPGNSFDTNITAYASDITTANMVSGSMVLNPFVNDGFDSNTSGDPGLAFMLDNSADVFTIRFYNAGLGFGFDIDTAYIYVYDANGTLVGSGSDNASTNIGQEYVDITVEASGGLYIDVFTDDFDAVDDIQILRLEDPVCAN